MLPYIPSKEYVIVYKEIIQNQSFDNKGKKKRTEKGRKN